MEGEQCEGFASNEDQFEVEFNNGETWRFDVDGAVKRDDIGPSAFPGEVAARMIIFKRRNNGRFDDTCPDEGRIDVWGTYVDKDENCAEYGTANQPSLHPHRTDCDENQQAFLDHNGARVLTICSNPVGSLVADFSIKVDGEWRSCGNGEPLVIY